MSCVINVTKLLSLQLFSSLFLFSHLWIENFPKHPAAEDSLTVTDQSEWLLSPPGLKPSTLQQITG
jgi:hypothetical protein